MIGYSKNIHRIPGHTVWTNLLNLWYSEVFLNDPRLMLVVILKCYSDGDFVRDVIAEDSPAYEDHGVEAAGGAGHGDDGAGGARVAF